MVQRFKDDEGTYGGSRVTGAVTSSTWMNRRLSRSIRCCTPPLTSFCQRPCKRTNNREVLQGLLHRPRSFGELVKA